MDDHENSPGANAPPATSIYEQPEYLALQARSEALRLAISEGQPDVIVRAKAYAAFLVDG